MTITCVTFIVGFIVPKGKYLEAVCGESLESLGEEFYIENDICSTSYENLHITREERSKVLTCVVLPHDNYENSVAIGIIIMQPDFAEVKYDGNEFEGNDLTESFKLAVDKIDPATENIKNELETIRDLNPDLYELLKDRKIKLLVVPDDCNCCS